MLNYENLVLNYKRAGYSIHNTAIATVVCAVSPELKNGCCQVVVLCNNYNQLIIGKSNIKEIQKVLECSAFLPREKKNYLYVIANGSENKKIKLPNVVMLCKSSYRIVHTKIDRELKEELKFVESLVTEKAMFYEKYCRSNNLHDTYHKVWGTYLIILATILCYLYTQGKESVYGISAQTVFDNKEWYRLFTYAFAHAGLLHLFGNMISLLYIGKVLEKHIGFAKVLVLYFISTFYGAVASLVLTSSTDRITVGASGAICGLTGALLAEQIYVKFKYKYSEAATVISVIMATCFTGFLNKNIDNWCHIGGLAGGMMFMIIFILCDEVENLQRLQKLRAFCIEKKKKHRY